METTDDDYSLYKLNDQLYAASKFTVSFKENASLEGKTDTELLVKRLLFSNRSVHYKFSLKGELYSKEWLQGLYLDSLDADVAGFHQTDIMVLDGAPVNSLYDTETLRSVIEEKIARQWELSGLPMQEYRSAYYTCLLKYAVPDKDGKDLMKEHLKNCLPVFEQELSFVRPKWILALGAKVLKAFLGLKSVKTEQMIGRVFEFDYTFADGTVLPLKILGLPGVADILSGKTTPYFMKILSRQMEFFKNHTRIDVINNTNCRVYVPVENTMPEGHRISCFASDLKEEVDRIMDLAKTDPKRKIIAVDMEWEGANPSEKDAHLLTAQFSTAPGEAFVVVLDGEETRTWQEKAVKSERKAIIKELNRLLTWHDDWRPRVGGHFLRADLPWLIDLGISGYEYNKDIRWSYMPAKTPEACRWYGGWDTSLMYHAYNEADQYGLKYLAAQWLDVPVWDTELSLFLADYESKHGEQNGFGCIPDHILHPYAAWDADATRQLAELCMFGYGKHETALLDDDGFGNDCWQPYWLAQRAALGFLEMEMTGLVMDRNRFAELSNVVQSAYQMLLQDFKQKIGGWEDFSPNSSAHKQAVLFGSTFGNTFDKAGHRITTLPEGIHSLNLQPIYESRDKKMWEDIILSHDEDEDGFRSYSGTYRPELNGYTAACDKDVLNLLAQSSKEAAQLRDICILQHTLDGILSPVTKFWDKYGLHFLYPKGHFKHIRSDGTIHSSMRQLLKTGRSSSKSPNLQNIGKSSEANLKRILGSIEKGEPSGDYLDILGAPMYLYPIRTMYIAPQDYVFMEADFTGAELAVMAWVSQDPTLLDHVKRNILPESDPNYYDIHSHIAVEAFRLDCPATKKGLASIGKKHLRVAAKSVVFGIPYGRGARAISFKCRSEGTPVTVEDAEAIVEHYFTKYPQTKFYLDRCKRAVMSPGYVKTLYGRCRRFQYSEDTPELVKRKMEREFCNAPIQGTVADAVNVAIYNLLKARYQSNLDFKIVMQIHDALLLQVHKRDAAEVYQHVLPNAMVNENPIIIDGKEYRFGIETELYKRWGSELTDAEALSSLGMSLKEITG